MELVAKGKVWAIRRGLDREPRRGEADVVIEDALPLVVRPAFARATQEGEQTGEMYTKRYAQRRNIQTPASVIGAQSNVKAIGDKALMLLPTKRHRRRRPPVSKTSRLLSGNPQRL